MTTSTKHRFRSNTLTSGCVRVVVAFGPKLNGLLAFLHNRHLRPGEVISDR